MSDLVERLRAVRPDGTLPLSGIRCVTCVNPDGPEAADEIEALRAERDQQAVNVLRVLNLYSGAWHPNSIFMQEHGAELQRIRERAAMPQALAQGDQP